MDTNRYTRDMRGYGRITPKNCWPNNALIAVQFVINYEEGGENCLLHGDDASEAFLSEIIGASAWQKRRHWNMESIYEYGARTGFWRLYRIFTEKAVPVTVFGVASALVRSPEQTAAMIEADWEVASHGLKWIEYAEYDEEHERSHMHEAIKLHTNVVGSRPLGWYTGRCSMNTVKLATKEGGFLYLSDSYADDLPYWINSGQKNQLIIPYTLDANDMRFATSQGFNTGAQFYTYLKDTFDVLYQEGKQGYPKMMSIGLHCRLAGRPGRAKALKKFLKYILQHKNVWLTRRIDIARHWISSYPSKVDAFCPSTFEKPKFMEVFSSVFEHSPWIAEKAWELELGTAHDCSTGIHNVLCQIFRAAPHNLRMEVLKCHPDLAGKLAQAKLLTTDSIMEQASAGLDELTEKERHNFLSLNSAYKLRHGFPFIIAVKDYDKQSILKEFNRRLGHSTDIEFDEACRQVERIAWFRICDLFETGNAN